MQKVLRPRFAAQHMGIGLSTLWKFAKERPDFPRPFKLSERVTVWCVSDLDAFIARQQGARHA